MQRRYSPEQPNAPPDLTPIVKARRRKLGRSALPKPTPISVEKVVRHGGRGHLEIDVDGVLFKVGFISRDRRPELSQMLPTDLVDILVGDKAIGPDEGQSTLLRIKGELDSAARTKPQTSVIELSTPAPTEVKAPRGGARRKQQTLL